MPVSNFTAKLLEMEDAIIEDLHTTNSEVHIFFSLKRKPHTCPHCHTVTEKVHDYRLSILKDLPIMSKESFRLLPKHCRITTRLAFYSIHLLRDRQSIRAVAELLGISDSSVFRRMQDVRFPKPSHLPKVLSIDEFRGNAGGQKFQAILTDADKHKLFSIRPSRSQVSLMQYLQPVKFS